MIDRVKRLDSLHQLAMYEEEKRLRVLGDFKNQLQQKRDQLEALKSYHQDYETQLKQESEAGVSSLRSQQLRDFMHYLQGLFGSQAQAIQHFEKLVQQKEEDWRKAHAQQESLKKFSTNLRKKIQIQQDIKEDRQITDDFVRRKYH